MRQATHHGCLPSLRGDGDNGIEVMYVEPRVQLSADRKTDFLYLQNKYVDERIGVYYFLPKPRF
jgi:hypothetical protein